VNVGEGRVVSAAVLFGVSEGWWSELVALLLHVTYLFY